MKILFKIIKLFIFKIDIENLDLEIVHTKPAIERFVDS